MSYPINDIFEGAGDLLVVHGVVELKIIDNDLKQETVYITYGGYYYTTIYADGELLTIRRMRKEGKGNGKDQG